MVDKGFNPRTHEECDIFSSISSMIFCVSIHALTRSATVYILMIMTDLRFQSTHSRGVRRAVTSVDSAIRQFQSTHSRGVRLSMPYCFITRQTVSIHALTRSATAHSLQHTYPLSGFNPRTHEECDGLLQL